MAVHEAEQALGWQRGVLRDLEVFGEDPDATLKVAEQLGNLYQVSPLWLCGEKFPLGPRAKEMLSMIRSGRDRESILERLEAGYFPWVKGL